MKKLLLIALILLVFACSRKGSTQDTSGASTDYYIRFKANGQTIEYSGSLVQQLTSGVQAQRTIMGIGPTISRQMYIGGKSDVDNYIQIAIINDSVQTGQSYSLNNLRQTGSLIISINRKQYATYDYVNSSQYVGAVTISQHSNGWVSGTFSGKLAYQTSTNSPYEELVVTDGTFKSKVVYDK